MARELLRKSPLLLCLSSPASGMEKSIFIIMFLLCSAFSIDPKYIECGARRNCRHPPRHVFFSFIMMRAMAKCKLCCEKNDQTRAFKGAFIVPLLNYNTEVVGILPIHIWRCSHGWPATGPFGVSWPEQSNHHYWLDVDGYISQFENT